MPVEGTGENSHYMTCQDKEETITVHDNSERFKQKSAQKKTETNSFKLQVNF